MAAIEDANAQSAADGATQFECLLNGYCGLRKTDFEFLPAVNTATAKQIHLDVVLQLRMSDAREC